MEVRVPNGLPAGMSSITVIVDDVSSNPVIFYVIRNPDPHHTPVDVDLGQVDKFSEVAHSTDH